MRTIELSEALFYDETRLHEAFAARLGFAPYGRDWDAWIELMSGLDETLEIEILVKDGTGYFETKAWGTFCACAAAVNGRRRDAGSPARLIITEKDVFGAG